MSAITASQNRSRFARRSINIARASSLIHSGISFSFMATNCADPVGVSVSATANGPPV